MTDYMATGVFRLKGRQLLEMGQRRGVPNVHQLSKRTDVSYPTVRRYIEEPEKVEAVSLKALTAFLVDGCGMSPAEISDLKFGDIFEYHEDVATE